MSKLNIFASFEIALKINQVIISTEIEKSKKKAKFKVALRGVEKLFPSIFKRW